MTQIQVSWDDPATENFRNPTLNLPIAFGREFNEMPAEIEGKRVSRMVLNSLEVSRYHALLDEENGSIVVLDQNSRNGLYINGQLQKRATLGNGDIIRLGPYEITIGFVGQAPTLPPPVRRSQIFFNPNTDLPDPNQIPPSPTPTSSNFPPRIFQEDRVEVQAIHATGLPVTEVNYLTIGGGLGSFIWVDFLRIYGVNTDQIAALGVDPKPYGRYQQLCLNSQIPLHERLRSNSDSCPDNIWGWPSYALREAWHNFKSGKIQKSLKYLWQVFAEPTLAETYTPKAGNVFASIDREQARIQWDKMFHYGRALSIRKTADGRYAIAYSKGTAGTREHAFFITQYLHLATGYPALKFLPDLQAYREKTGDFQSVVNAYEPHDSVYEYLEKNGGTVLIRGRGIVASRIIQRLYEARQKNSSIRVINLMRSPNSQGHKFGHSQRIVEHHMEFQPFNWPKACWGGELRVQLENADPEKRKSLIADWGGTTTADRADWRRIMNEGITQGWYSIEFGQVERVEKEANGIVTYIQDKNYKGTMRLEANFIIDATGLDADVTASPLLEDLVTHYNLPLNNMGRLAVSNDFELVEMRGIRGRMYAIGAITLGGPYAAVDSFLGLQYASLKIVDSLAIAKAANLKKLNAIASTLQWLKWVTNTPPTKG
ncbi:MAG: FHA domain-containing protein [Chroococcales cyanobacterium]